MIYIFRAGYNNTIITNERQTMAYNNNNTTGNRKTQQRQPIHDCKVCIDAGKSPEECASHYVKDRAGNVTCPTLLNQKCLLCGVCGHTASYCKTSTKTTTKEPTKETKAPTRIQPNPQPTKERPQCSNKYAILGLLEAEAERVKEQLVVAFPPLDPKPEYSRPSTTTKTSAISTWASRLKSPPSPFSHHSEQDEKQQQQQQQQQQHQRRKPTKPVAIAVSWAD